jgi:dihydroorotase
MIMDKMCRAAISRVSREIRKRSLALTTQGKAGMSIFPMGMRFLLAILLLPAWSTAQTQYDLVIKGGEVIDPRSGVQAARDVAIRDHKIAAIEKDIPAAEAIKVINARGLLVTPGLVDIHTHAYAGTGRKDAYDGDNSVYPDDFTFRSCVTTVVDAGSSGWRNFPDFKDRIIDRSKTRVLAFINIVGNGMDGGAAEQNTGDMDPAAAAAMAKQFPDSHCWFPNRSFRRPGMDRGGSRGGSGQAR